MIINRSIGDTSPVKVLWTGEVDFTDVTAITLTVYSDQDKQTQVETLTGEMRGFDPATYFPIIDANWTGVRWWTITITRGVEVKPLPTVYKWEQA